MPRSCCSVSTSASSTWILDTNYLFNEQSQDSIRRLQYAQTLSLSHPIRGRLGFTGEIWHFSQPFLQSNAVGLLLTPAYNVKPNLVLDMGFNRGLTSTSTRWVFFTGFTYLLPKKLWQSRGEQKKGPATRVLLRELSKPRNSSYLPLPVLWLRAGARPELPRCRWDQLCAALLPRAGGPPAHG